MPLFWAWHWFWEPHSIERYRSTRGRRRFDVFWSRGKGISECLGTWKIERLISIQTNHSACRKEETNSKLWKIKDQADHQWSDSVLELANLESTWIAILIIAATPYCKQTQDAADPNDHTDGAIRGTYHLKYNAGDNGPSRAIAKGLCWSASQYDL